MKRKSILAIALIFCFLFQLTACDNRIEEPSVPTGTEQSGDITDPTDPAADHWSSYRDARKAAEMLTNYNLSFQYRLSYQVDSENYLETSTGTAAYSGRGNAFQAFIREELAFGSYETQYYRSYADGMGYCRVDNSNFSCSLTADEFTSQVIPAVLLNENNYGTITQEAGEDGRVFSFRDAIRIENWANSGSNLELTNASGTAKLNSDDQLVESSYHAEYVYGGTRHILDVTVRIDNDAQPDFSGQPIYGEDCPVVSDLMIPRLLVQAVGAIFSTQNMRASYTDTLYAEAFSRIRSQQGSCEICGSDQALKALVSTHVSVTDYTGTAVTNSQEIAYADGVYSYSTNGGDATTMETVTPEDMRIYCEDTILSSLFSLGSIGGADLRQTEDYIYIEFDGNSQYSDSICAGIYDIFGFNLDSYATSYETGECGGYLTLNRYTRMPVTAGMFLERTHYISGVPHRLTYQLDQTMELPSASVYETLTGDSPAEQTPDTLATPLLYKVSGPDGQQMWLFGTVDIGDARTAFLPQQITSAFAEADALAVEYDALSFDQQLLTDPQLQQDFADAYYYSDRSTVSDHLEPSISQDLEMMMRICGKNSINAPYTRVFVWRELIESFYLSQGSSLTTEKAMNIRLLDWAAAQNKPIYETGSGLSQLQIHAELSDALQQMLLQATLDGAMLGHCSDAEALYQLWCQGDAERLAAYLEAENEEFAAKEPELWKEYKKAMLTNRSKAMAKAAKHYLESGETVFFAVDLALIYGDGGVIQRLLDAGYTVEPVNYE